MENKKLKQVINVFKEIVSCFFVGLGSLALMRGVYFIISFAVDNFPIILFAIIVITIGGFIKFIVLS